MIIPTVIMGTIALILFAMGYYRGEGQHITGMKSALSMTIEIIPLLIFAFIIAGMVQVLISQEIIARWVGTESGMRGILIGSVAGGLCPGGPFVSLARWVGTESGMRGILIGSVAGGLCPGGPFVSLPIAAGLLRSGASTGTMVAFITGWSIAL
ncbi:MAG: permease [Deltaproteobacteria bacterium]|nr:permease [Deltaproteobacteria bacterium]